MVKLGEVLTLSKVPVTINPLSLYKQVTVRLFHKGLMLHEEKTGQEIQSNEWLVKKDQFLISRIDARNGAMGIVPPELDGAVVTNDFLRYDIDTDRLDVNFFDFLTSTENFIRQCGKASEGTTNRKRLRPDLFLDLEISIPPLEKQQRIVVTLEQLMVKIEGARKERAESIEELVTLLSNTKITAFPKPHTTTVGDFVKFQTGYSFKSEWFSDEGVRLVRNANIGHGKLDWSDTMRIPDLLGKQFENFELREGDILVSLDRPIISTGIKVAKVSEADLPCLLLQRVARAQFDESKVDANYFFQWLTSPNFIMAINPGRSSGVPHISQKEIERIPFSLPSLPEQRSIVAHFDRLQAKVDEVKRLQAATERDMVALVPAVLAKAFGGRFANDQRN
jgi:type I restriction enzyme S subunit